ncbi:MBL fold metallo-hydrolase [Shewanella algae]|uniref:MBL fold metallo-hydrolase n=1 Tax=Shewanella algae TaxID=38313 RepID=UPI0029366C69|nr:MBL fold metallo-hydrolase [Shewanella algae]MDV2960292.1 MBL fold metallo-hydrolase [Shewanella algae]
MLKSLVLAASLVLPFSLHAESDALDFKVYNADGNSFHVNATLITGDKEAILVDTGFTRADALRLAAEVLDSGKQLTTVFVSQADPDYYFGVATLKQFFPKAKYLTTPAVHAQISAKLEDKLSFWIPRMGSNAPLKAQLPEIFKGRQLMLEGKAIEIKGDQGMLADRPYLWVPSSKTILGNVAVSGGLHLWMADSQSQSERAAWKAQLAEMAALKPAKVIPGHMLSESFLEQDNIAATLKYLQDFEQAEADTQTSAELIDTMQRLYPNAGLGMALEIGAKVSKGEMKW